MWNALDPNQLGLESWKVHIMLMLWLIVLDLEHFKVLGGLVFCLFTLYSHFMVFFIFLCLYYTNPCKTLSMNVTWEFNQNSRQTKEDNEKFKLFLETIHVYNTFLIVFYLS